MLTYLGQTPGKREILDLATLCQNGLSRLQPQLLAHVRLETAIPISGPKIRANPALVHQVLACLFVNASEAIADRSGTIRVTVDTTPPGVISDGYRRPADFQPLDTAYACLTVTDTGCGIAAADFGKLFDPFFTTKFTGRGMGLAVALGIVRSHDGAIVVESTPGQGSTFRVFFPVRQHDVVPHRHD